MSERNKLHLRARSEALRELINRHPEEYRELYNKFADEFFNDAGLERLPRGRPKKKRKPKPNWSPPESRVPEEATARYLAGESLADLGKEYGVSRQRVDQMMDKRLTPEERKQAKQTRREVRHQAWRERVLAFAQENPDALVGDFPMRDNRYGESIGEVLGREEVQRRWSASFDSREFPGVTDEEAFKEMRRVQDLFPGEPLYRSTFDTHSRVLTAVRLTQRFDTWTNACREAGVIPPATPDREYIRDFDVDRCLEAVRQYLDECGRYASYGGYIAWRKEQNGRPLPSAGTLRNRVDRSWRTIRDIAMEDHQ